MVNDIEELMDLDMNPKRNRCGGRALAKMSVRQHFDSVAEGKLGTYPSVRCSMSWAIVFTAMGRGFKVRNELCASAW